MQRFTLTRILIFIGFALFTQVANAQYKFGFDISDGYDNFNNGDTTAAIEIAMYNSNQDTSAWAIGGTVFAMNGTAIDSVHFHFKGPQTVVFPKGTVGYRNVKMLKINPVPDTKFYGQRYFYLTIDNLIGVLKTDLNFGRQSFMVILDYDGTSIGIPKVSIREYTLFPNPAQDIIHFSGVNSRQYSITDMSGKTVLNGETMMNSIDISSLVPGLYFIRSETDKGLVLHKFIKE